MHVNESTNPGNAWIESNGMIETESNIYLATQDVAQDSNWDTVRLFRWGHLGLFSVADNRHKTGCDQLLPSVLDQKFIWSPKQGVGIPLNPIKRIHPFRHLSHQNLGSFRAQLRLPHAFDFMSGHFFMICFAAAVPRGTSIASHHFRQAAHGRVLLKT